MKQITSMLLATLVFAGSAYAAADLAALKTTPSVDADGTIQLNNAVCPISGEEITKDGSSLKLDGVVYKFCCAMCGGKLEKNPEKYAILEDDKKAILEQAHASA